MRGVCRTCRYEQRKGGWRARSCFSINGERKNVEYVRTHRVYVMDFFGFQEARLRQVSKYHVPPYRVKNLHGDEITGLDIGIAGLGKNMYIYIRFYFDLKTQNT